jgi:SAM-dependent methyltransferase
MTFVKADGGYLPLRDGCADTVFCTDVLEHVGEWNGYPDKREARRVLCEILRVAGNNGKCIICVPNRWFPIDVHTHLPLNYLPRLLRDSIISVLRKMSPEQYIPNFSLFSLADFKSLSIKEIHYVAIYGLGFQNIEKSIVFRIITKLSRVKLLEKLFCSHLVLVLNRDFTI